MPPADASRLVGHWKERIRSPRFQRELKALLAREIRAAGRTKLQDLVDNRQVRRWLAAENVVAMDERLLADLVIEASRVVDKKLRGKKTSLRGMMDVDLAAGIDAVFEQPIVLSRQAEKFIDRLMGQDLIQDLFTDIIHTSIVSFYKRVNPLFGGVTILAIDRQIRGFIRLVMPMIQQQATAFLIDRRNQEVFADFTRAVAYELLSEPLPRLMALVSIRRDQRTRTLIQDLVRSPKFQMLNRELTLAIWDNIFPRIRNRTLDEILRVEENADAWAELAAKELGRALLRTEVLEFLARETTLVAKHLRS